MNRRRFQYYQIKKRTERGEKVGKNGCWLKGQSQNPTKALKNRKEKNRSTHQAFGKFPHHQTKPKQNKPSHFLFLLCFVKFLFMGTKFTKN
jgi:hypothetical protein